MSSNTFFNILAVFGVLYGIWRALKAIGMHIILTRGQHRGVYAYPRFYVLSVIGLITFFAGIYKLFVQ